jgi:hypothetical protein
MESLEHEEELDWNAWPGRQHSQIAEEQAAQGWFYSSSMIACTTFGAPL